MLFVTCGFCHLLIILSSILTTQKLIKAAEILNIPIFVTTQNRARLGATCADLSLAKAVADVDKTRFSMWVPEIEQAFHQEFPNRGSTPVALVGIESHICITQTALDLLNEGQRVYIIADGVSSCNREEIPIALERLRKAGAIVTTSESFLYECMGDAGIKEFKQIAGLVKETSAQTKDVLSTLLSSKI